MNFTQLKRFMDKLVAWRIPGNDVSVWLDNREVFRYQSGYMDVEKKTPMSDNCLVNIYSCTKVATAVAATQLLERGDFVLDTPLYDFIPEYKDMHVKGKDGCLRKAEKPITIRHLFTMTSGMTYSLTSEIRKEASDKTDGRFDTVEVVKLMSKMPLSFEPGERWQYSFCHDVLAAVVEIVSGKKYRDYVKENIFDPLGMTESFFHKTPDIEKRMAPQYNFVTSEADTSNQTGGFTQSVDLSKCGGSLVRTDGSNSLVFGAEYDSGGAGIITSVADYVKLVNALANRGMGATGERILSPFSVELMKRNQLSCEQIKTFSWEQLRGYGYGLGVRTMVDPAEAGSLSSVGEFGWGGAAGASVFVDTELKLGVFYAHHMLNPQESYYQPRLRNAIYSCLD